MIMDTKRYGKTYRIIQEKDKEIERLHKENNDLRKLYQRTYKHLFEIGNDELARYFQAQIDECPTFYVEPIIDYYEETKRLNKQIEEYQKALDETMGEKIDLENSIKNVREYIENNDIMKVSKEKETKGSIFCCDKELLEILDKGI